MLSRSSSWLYRGNETIVIATDTSNHIGNNQAPGIGTVVSLDGYLIINNLGRDVEICRFNGHQLERVARISETLFAEDITASEFDFDMHAILLSPDRAHLLLLNHFGIIRAFPWIGGAGDNHPLPANEFSRYATVSPSAPDITPSLWLKWPADVETMLAVQDHLLSTSSIGYAVEEQTQAGVLISQPWKELSARVGTGALARAGAAVRTTAGDIAEAGIDTRCRVGFGAHSVAGAARTDLAIPVLKHAATWTELGITTAIAYEHHHSLLAVAASDTIVVQTAANLLLHAQRSQEQRFSLDFAVSYLHFLNHDLLLAAGPAHLGYNRNNPDWNNSKDGGWVLLSLQQNRIVTAGSFEQELAWGNGGYPLLCTNEKLYFVDRYANLYCCDIASGAVHCCWESPNNRSLGIAHLVKHQQLLVCGFNRGGYNIYSYGSIAQ